MHLCTLLKDSHTKDDSYTTSPSYKLINHFSVTNDILKYHKHDFFIKIKFNYVYYEETNQISDIVLKKFVHFELNFFIFSAMNFCHFIRIIHAEVTDKR